MKYSSKLIFQGLVTLSVATVVLALWMIVVIPEFEKLSDQYSLDMEYDAQTTMVKDVYGELYGPYFQHDVLSEKVIAKNGNVLTIQSSVVGKRIDTNEIMFQVENTYSVDATTQMHIDKEGKRFGFLPGVEKKDYDFFHPAVFYDDPMLFKKTDFVNGLEVYVFEVTTKDADTSHAFPQFAPHEIHTNTISKLWIEPITGNLLQFEKSWDNYLVEDGKRINTIQIGGKNSTEFTELILTQYTKTKIENIQFNNVFMPIFFLILIFGAGFIWILLTHLKKIEQESNEKNQMMIIGSITAKISHDLRNPLSVIKSSLELNELKEITPELRGGNTKRALRGVDRIEYQIESILNFVRNKPLKKEKVQLKTIIESAIENSQIPQDIKVEKNIPDITIFVDFNQIETVFSNIITNAIQAISKGKISITAKVKTNVVEIEFEDSGSGIPNDLIKDIFEPLFTTKKKGIGLGLASCNTLIKKHGGNISVKNNPTRFTITLPK